MTAIKVTVRRDGKWWMVEVPQINGLTQARHVSEVEAMARSLITMSADGVDGGSIDLDIHYVVPGVKIEVELAAIARDQERARDMEARAKARRARVMAELSARNVPIRDIAELFDMSFQRVHQILADQPVSATG